MLALLTTALAFQLNAKIDRRSLLGAAVALSPAAAFAEGQTSASTLYKAKNTYGQRVLRLVDATPQAILDEAK